MTSITILALRAGAIVLWLLPQVGCSDDQPLWELEDLTPDQGFSLRIPLIEVPQRKESQNCYFVRVPDLDDGGDVWIDRVLSAMNPGSHHMNVFRVRTILDLRPEDGEPVQIGDYQGTLIEGHQDTTTSPCWNSSNWADWPLVTNTQHSSAEDPYTDWQLPDGVAIRLQPGEMLMVQTHYVNSTDQPTNYGGEVGINFYSHHAAGEPIELGTLFATQQNIRICQGVPDVTYSGTCHFPASVTIAAANGHFHKRGRRFSIYPWDGASVDHPDSASMFYQSLAWDDPPMARGLDVTTSGIWWDCQYQWTPPSLFSCDDVNAKDPEQEGDCCYTFGGNTDVGEHCNVFVYYYPRRDSDVFCN